MYISLSLSCMRTLSLYDSDGNVCVGSIEMGIDSKLKCTVLSLSLSLSFYLYVLFLYLLLDPME